MDSGTFTLNSYTTDTGRPFGGSKSSGLSREFGPRMAEFLQYPTITDPVRRPERRAHPHDRSTHA